MSVTQLKTSRDSEERQLRVDLAAAFRLTVEMGWHEGVGNHFSAAVSPDGKSFLMNRKWRHFSTIKASDLQLLDADNDSIMKTPEAPTPRPGRSMVASMPASPMRACCCTCIRPMPPRSRP
jgi:hypothetical protein